MKEQYIILKDKEKRIYYGGMFNNSVYINKAIHFSYTEYIAAINTVRNNGWKFVKIEENGNLIEV